MPCPICPYLMQAFAALWGAMLRSLPLLFLAACLSFALACVGLWLLRRAGFFERRSRPWKLWTFSYYLFVPVACVLFATSVTATLKLKRETHHLLENSLQPAVHQILSEKVAELRAPYPVFTVGDFEARLRGWIAIDYVEGASGTWNALKSRVGKRLIAGYNRWVVPFAVKALLLQCSTDALIAARDVTVLTDCVIGNAEHILIGQIKKQSSAIFHGMLLSATLLFLGAMAVQFLEAGIYFFWYKKRDARPLPNPTI